jgi:hypothetical protein
MYDEDSEAAIRAQEIALGGDRHSLSGRRIRWPKINDDTD